MTIYPNCSPYSVERWEERQPDGGRLESCVIIDLENVHSTDHWYDVPCVSTNDANQFICMKANNGMIYTWHLQLENDRHAFYIGGKLVVLNHIINI